MTERAGFEQDYQVWWKEQIIECSKNGSEESKRRLEAGHGHAEQQMLKHIWWPAFNNLKWLQAEYEVIDYREGPRYIDFAYIRAPFKIAFEIDGYGPHIRDLSRRQFCDQWVRQMHLINDGWLVVRIGFDDVKERPRIWQQLLQQLIGRLYGCRERQLSLLEYTEKELIRLAIRKGEPIKLKDVEQFLNCGYRKARVIIQGLVDKHYLICCGGGTVRSNSWRLAEVAYLEVGL